MLSGKEEKKEQRWKLQEGIICCICVTVWLPPVISVHFRSMDPDVIAVNVITCLVLEKANGSS